MRIEHITVAAGGERKKEGKQQQQQECLKGVNLSISEIRYFGRFNLFGRSMSSSASFPPSSLFAKVFLPRERWAPSIFRNGPQSSCNVINTQNCGSRETSIKWVAWWRFSSFPCRILTPSTSHLQPMNILWNVKSNTTAQQTLSLWKGFTTLNTRLKWLRFVHFEILLLLSKLF